MNDRTSRRGTFAVVGATGKQRGAAARALIGGGAHVRVLVRDVDSEASRSLHELGAELVRANLDDAESLTSAFAGVDGVFAMTTGIGERTASRSRYATDARLPTPLWWRRVPRVVYSSVGGAERKTGIPHFESKRRIEEYMLDRLDVRFVRPTFFMENLANAAKPTEDDEVVFRFPLPPTRLCR